MIAVGRHGSCHPMGDNCDLTGAATRMPLYLGVGPATRPYPLLEYSTCVGYDPKCRKTPRTFGGISQGGNSRRMDKLERISIVEAAHDLGIPTATLFRLIDEGYIAAFIERANVKPGPLVHNGEESHSPGTRRKPPDLGQRTACALNRAPKRQIAAPTPVDWTQVDPSWLDRPDPSWLDRPEILELWDG